MEVFTPEEDERFIYLVSQFPILYDTKHVDFKEQHLKDNIWKDISKELNKDYHRLKRHWRNIRDGYARFKRCKSAKTDNKHPRSKWQFYKLLTFLDGVAQERMETNYVDDLPRSNDGESEDMTYSAEAEFVSFDSLQDSNTPIDATEKIATCSTSVNSVNEHPIGRRVSSETNFENLLNYFKERDERRHSSAASQSQNNNPDNDVASFSMHVKDILNKLPPVLQIKAKRDLFEVLFKYELMAVQQAKAPRGNLASGSKNSNSKSEEYPLNYFSKVTD